MNRNHSGLFFMPLCKKISAGMIVFFAATFLSLTCIGQSYFYFETQAKNGGDSIVNFYTFLTIQPEGTATARVLYSDSATGETHLLEVAFTDSFAVKNDDNEAYLVPAGNYQLLAGNDARQFMLPRFILKLQKIDQETFYAPVAIEYQANNGTWYAGEMRVNQPKTLDDLGKERELVDRFFNETDALYPAPRIMRNRANGNHSRREKFYLVVVANTKDSSIGITTKIDLQNITSTFTQLALSLDLKIVTATISGDTFSKRAVESAINKLAPGPSDIVVFYYSGHGFRYTQDKSKYPRMSLRKNRGQDLSLNNLSVEDVYNRILKKGARVSIVLADCCNDDIGAMPPVGRRLLGVRGGRGAGGGPQINLSNCNALFFPDHRVSILSTAAEAKQLATGNPLMGGFFTNYFRIFLEKSLYGFESSPSWIKLLTDARERAARQALTAMCGTDRCVQRAEVSVTPLQ